MDIDYLIYGMWINFRWLFGITITYGRINIQLREVNEFIAIAND